MSLTTKSCQLGRFQISRDPSIRSTWMCKSWHCDVIYCSHHCTDTGLMQYCNLAAGLGRYLIALARNWSWFYYSTSHSPPPQIISFPDRPRLSISLHQYQLSSLFPGILGWEWGREDNAHISPHLTWTASWNETLYWQLDKNYLPLSVVYNSRTENTTARWMFCINNILYRNGNTNIWDEEFVSINRMVWLLRLCRLRDLVVQKSQTGLETSAKRRFHKLFMISPNLTRWAPSSSCVHALHTQRAQVDVKWLMLSISV